MIIHRGMPLTRGTVKGKDVFLQYSKLTKEKKMKKLFPLVIILSAVFLASCSSNQNSSEAEAKYFVEHLDDFQQFVQYFSVESKGNILSWAPDPPNVYKSEPALKDEGKNFVHEIIYKTKNGSFKFVVLNDDRPSKVIATVEFR